MRGRRRPRGFGRGGRERRRGLRGRDPRVPHHGVVRQHRARARHGKTPNPFTTQVLTFKAGSSGKVARRRRSGSSRGKPDLRRRSRARADRERERPRPSSSTRRRLSARSRSSSRTRVRRRATSLSRRPALRGAAKPARVSTPGAGVLRSAVSHAPALRLVRAAGGCVGERAAAVAAVPDFVEEVLRAGDGLGDQSHDSTVPRLSEDAVEIDRARIKKKSRTRVRSRSVSQGSPCDRAAGRSTRPRPR